MHGRHPIRLASLSAGALLAAAAAVVLALPGGVPSASAAQVGADAENPLAAIAQTVGAAARDAVTDSRDALARAGASDGDRAAPVLDGTTLLNGGDRYAGMSAPDMLADAYANGYTRVENLHDLGISRDAFNDAVMSAANSGEYYYVNVDASQHTWRDSDGIITDFDVAYVVGTDDLPAYKAAFEARASEALRWVSDDMTDVQKAQALHDFLVRTVSYDEAARDDATDDGHPEAHTAYGALVDRSCVCDGYALAYTLLLARAGVSSIVVVSDGMDHSWNMVRLDGAWYHVDVTYDDPMPDGGPLERPSHEYFLRGDASMTSAVGVAHTGWRVRNDVGELPEAPSDYAAQQLAAGLPDDQVWPTEYDGPLAPDAAEIPATDGLFTSSDGYVYLAEAGSVARGERQLDGFWYYFNETTGIMAASRFARLPDGRLCYYDASGHMLYGEQRIGDAWYWLDTSSGAMARSSLVGLPDGRTCYYGADGRRAAGEVQCADGAWRDFDPADGAMARDAFERFSDGRISYYGDDGARAAGWQVISGYELYFDPATGALDESSVPAGVTFS